MNKPTTAEKTKAILIIAAVIAMPAALVLTLFLYPWNSSPIDKANGCPEFYGVEFGMSKAEIKAAAGVYESDDMDILLYQNKGSAGGAEIKTAYLGLDAGRLNSATLFFDARTTSYEELKKIYSDIYGSPTGGKARIKGRSAILIGKYSDAQGSTAVWQGNSTTITIHAPQEYPNILFVHYCKSDVKSPQMVTVRIN